MSTQPQNWKFQCQLCASPAVMVCPGQEAVTHQIGPKLVTLRRGIPVTAVCLAHAQSIGLPWPSEQPSRRPPRSSPRPSASSSAAAVPRR